jgi:hypothetical protein
MHLNQLGGNEVIDVLGLNMLVKSFIIVYNHLVVYLVFSVTPHWK